MPQVATSMSKELGPFVDGPPVEMCESYATPGPAGCAGAARDPRDPDVTLTKLVPRLSVAMIVWFVMIILLRAPVSSWHSPSRLLRLELWAWRQSYCSPAKIHRVVEGPHGADAGPQLQLSAPAPQANCSTTARSTRTCSPLARHPALRHVGFNCALGEGALEASSGVSC